MLPPPPELFTPTRRYPVDWDLYDAAAWGIPCVRQDYLDDARRYHRALADSDPQVEMIEIAGCNRSTVTDVSRAEGGETLEGLPSFTAVEQDGGPDSGDERVPLWSTQMEGVTSYYVNERHLFLPSNRECIEAILALVRGEKPGLSREVPQPPGLLEKLREMPLGHQVRELRQRIEAGEFSRKDLYKLFFAR